MRGLAGAGLLMAAIALSAGAGSSASVSSETSDPAPLAVRSLLLGLVRTDGRLVAVGDRGHVLTSDDDGRSWRQTGGVPTRAMLTAVCFSGARGYAVGHDEIILLSRDAGRSWTRAHDAPEAQQPLLDVWCGEGDRGIAIGAYGSFFLTTDGGRSWVSQHFEPRRAAGPASAGADESPPDYHLNCIVAAGGSRLYIGAEAGRLYRSDDAGATWRELPSPYEGSFYGLLPLGDPDRLLAFGLRGRLFRTDDGGQHWQRLDTGTVAMLTGGTRLDDGRIAIVGLAGTVLLSDDGWRFRLLQQPDRLGMSAVLAAGGAGLVVVGEEGARLVSLGGRP